MNQAFQNRFIDPKVLSGLSNLQIVAKAVVEGFVSGLHRSPFHGFSMEFREYREYTPGDDIKGVDWKVYGRSDRFYVKKFEGDTNARIHIALDASKSMDFTSHTLTKLDYARYLTASLAYFAIRQKDPAGLLAFDSGIIHHIPPRARSGQFMSILQQLEHLQPGGNTDIGKALQDLGNLIRQRSLVVVISDFYQELDPIAKALRYFHYRGNDLILFHILDPMEIDLPIDDSRTLQDMETGERSPYEPSSSRQHYLERLQEHIEALKKECRANAIDYELINTEEPLDKALRRYLMVRARNS